MQQRSKVIILILTVLLLVFVFGSIYNVSESLSKKSLAPTPALGNNAAGCQITGCNGEICSETSKKEEEVTDCMWKEEYGCYKKARCERQPNGDCDWTMDEILTRCLTENR